MHIYKKIKFEMWNFIFNSKYLIRDFYTYMKEKYCKMPKPVRVKIEKNK